MTQILIPVSIGELYDKITILSIRHGNLLNSEDKVDDRKLENVKTELELLQKVAEDNPIDPKFQYDLFNINNRLWGIEDKIRLKERTQIWGDEFVDLARSVYFSNDIRGSIKRDINLRYDSSIIEEKTYQEYK